MHTAGGLAEGGYLGFTELEYVHIPLPGERLVVFLSDGAFEEQRGSDWAARWWRAEDSGLVAPVMIKNGRRIDQRTTLSQQGGSDWLAAHLRLNGFDPFEIDGRDPAAFAWAILEMEARLGAAAAAVRSGTARYPVPLPYCIAVAPKGAGFPGEGTNLAHNLPLPGNPRTDSRARQLFNEGARRLWVPHAELVAAAAKLRRHEASGRPPERDHALAKRSVTPPATPAVELRAVPEDRSDPARWTRSSPMDAVDRTFLQIVLANRHLRPRVGNPDEMKSNRMIRTLEALKFRVTDPEPGVPESVDGAVITALNEEAVAAAAIGNSGGINMVVTYEAFGAKMQGLFRQEVIWAAHRSDAGQPSGRLSVPLVLTSHTWENSKNEQSHQDPVMAESMMGERADFSRVVFAADANTAACLVAGVFATQGQIWTLVVPKLPRIAELFSPREAVALLDRGALRLDWAGHRTRDQRVVLTAIGAYQLEQVLAASRRLAARDVPHSVVYIVEPGRFREPSCAGEEAHAVGLDTRSDLYPPDVPARVFLTHTRPGPLRGVLHRIDSGERTAVLGYQNHGGTLDVDGLLFVNRSTWAHAVDAVARVTGSDRRSLLEPRGDRGARRADEPARPGHPRARRPVIHASVPAGARGPPAAGKGRRS